MFGSEKSIFLHFLIVYGHKINVPQPVGTIPSFFTGNNASKRRPLLWALEFRTRYTYIYIKEARVAEDELLEEKEGIMYSSGIAD